MKTLDTRWKHEFDIEGKRIWDSALELEEEEENPDMKWEGVTPNVGGKGKEWDIQRPSEGNVMTKKK